MMKSHFQPGVPPTPSVGPIGRKTRARELRHVDRDGGAIETEEKIWDLTHAINVKGLWFGGKHAIIAMRKVSHHSDSNHEFR